MHGFLRGICLFYPIIKRPFDKLKEFINERKYIW